MDYKFISSSDRREVLKSALGELEREHNRLALSLVSNEASTRSLQGEYDALGDSDAEN